MTNYDRIKSMSAEEMAEFMERVTEHLETCTCCPAYKMCDAHIKCGENIKQWLLQEVDVMYRLTRVQKEVILAFAENNMNVSKTARAMNYHRNTMVYHLAKIYDDCKLNPYYFYDLVELVNMSKGGD